MTRSSRGSSRRGRWSFSAEFKGEAVRLMRERKALGVSVAQIGRELDVRPAVLALAGVAWGADLRGRSAVPLVGGVLLLAGLYAWVERRNPMGRGIPRGGRAS